jgi:alkane 1-monooxygenase
MDKRVIAHYGGEVTLANIQPGKRATVLERYAAAPRRSAVPAA